MKALLVSLHAYHAEANAELVARLAALGATLLPETANAALRLMNHALVVARIFKGHLAGEAHGYASDNTEETPSVQTLAAAFAETDLWYQTYLTEVTEDALRERLAFTFTDGDRGAMTRAEMVTHVVLHGGYHRGEVGRLLWSLAITPPWDTYAVHLHRSEPNRRWVNGQYGLT